MRKFWSLIAMAGALLGAVSCTPVGGPYQGPNGTTGVRSGIGAGSASPDAVVTAGPASGTRATSGDLRRLREQRAGIGNETVINPGAGFPGRNGASPGSGAQGGFTSGGGDETIPPLPPLNIDYPYAIPVPGRKGWVFNHYTNRPVDVRGVESGRLIYDERDPANRFADGTLKPVAQMPNKFRVP